MENKKVIEVSAAVIVKDGNILAAQRGYGEFKGKWEFPGGKLKEGETEQEALKREIKEELNADIEVGDHLITVNYDYPEFHLIMHTYLCSLINDVNFVYHSANELEHDNLVWLDNDNIDYMDWLPADIEIVNAYKKMNKKR